MATIEQLRKTANALREIEELRLYRKMDFYVPYPKQEKFHNAGVLWRERLLRAGNQLGKTLSGSMEVAYHLTSEYPDWWLGRRWDRPTKWWVASKTGLSTRDTVQKYLCGEAGVESLKGTGSIPRKSVNWKDGVTLARGVADLYDTVQVKHKTGGLSILRFKSYDQGREKWQGETLDGIWFDEEPDLDIYLEGLTRITATKGLVFMTFTPLKGKSDVVLRYLTEPSADRGAGVMTICRAPHFSPEEKAKTIAGYAAYQREARARGEPVLGEGRVFLHTEESLSAPAVVPRPEHWFYLWGIDFGINHPFAAVLIGWDKDTDVVHIIHTIRMRDARP